MNKSFSKLLRLFPLVLFVLLSINNVKAVQIDSKLTKGKYSVEYVDKLLKQVKEFSPDSKVEIELLQKLKKKYTSSKQLRHGPLLPAQKDLKNISSDEFWRLFQSVSKFIDFVESIENKIEGFHEKGVVLRGNILNADKVNEEVQHWQIQYAIYWLKIKNLNEASPDLKKEVILLKEKLYRLLDNVSYSVTKIEKDWVNLNLKKVELEKELMLQSIEMDQNDLISMAEERDSERADQTLKNFENLQLTLIRVKIEKSFAYLKEEEPKESLLAILEAKALLVNINFSEKKQVAIKTQIDLAHHLLAKNISALDLLQYNTSHSFIEVIDKGLSLISEPIIFYDDKKITIWGTIKFTLIFTFGFLFAQLYKRKINAIDHSRYNIAATNKTIISNLGYYLIVLITFFAALNLLGLDLSSLTVVAGALSVGIGFGLQKIFANFMSGLIMMFEKSIKMGDYIEVSSNLRGRVTEIRMRSSTITTNDNISLIIPNSTLIESNVINWTLNDTIVRLQIPFSVAYGTSYKALEKAVLEGLEESSLNYLKHDKSRGSELRMTQMNTSGVDYCLLVWVSGISTKFSEKTKSEFLKFIYNSLAEHEIEIPFPQLDVHVKKD
jgi:potassium efflux system protein